MHDYAKERQIKKFQLVWYRKIRKIDRDLP